VALSQPRRVRAHRTVTHNTRAGEQPLPQLDQQQLTTSVAVQVWSLERYRGTGPRVPYPADVLAQYTGVPVLDNVLALT